MPTFNDPVADADELREAVRGLAHATRTVEDPTAIYRIIGSLSTALASMDQVLQQLAAAHDHMATTPATTPPGSTGPSGRADRAAADQVSWELHRAAEMVRHVVDTVERAHQVEAAITYDVHLPPPPLSLPTPLPMRTARRTDGLSL